MNGRTLERCFSGLIILLGCYVLTVSLHMDIMTEDGPGPGFIPTGIGVLLAFFGAWVFVASKHVNDMFCLDKKTLVSLVTVVFAAVLAIILADTVGLLLMLGVLAGFLAWFAGASAPKALTTSILVCVVFHFIFTVLLNSGFPKGFLGI